MNPRQRTLLPENNWQCLFHIDTLIERARFALLHRGVVTLIMPFVEGRHPGFGLAYQGSGGGLHHDFDTSYTNESLGRYFEDDEAEFTAEWSECEKYLLRPRLSPRELEELANQK